MHVNKVMQPKILCHIGAMRQNSCSRSEWETWSWAYYGEFARGSNCTIFQVWGLLIERSLAFTWEQYFFSWDLDKKLISQLILLGFFKVLRREWSVSPFSFLRRLYNNRRRQLVLAIVILRPFELSVPSWLIDHDILVEGIIKNLCTLYSCFQCIEMTCFNFGVLLVIQAMGKTTNLSCPNRQVWGSLLDT